MREQTIQNQINHILTAFPEGETRSRSAISSAEIPESIRHFLLTTLDRKLELEAIQSMPTQSAWFDVEDERVHVALRQTILAMSLSARFPSEEFSKIVRQAVENVLNYLISPVETLVSFIFPNGADSVTANDVRRKTGYFSDYPYLRMGVDAYLKRKGELRIFKPDFEKTVSHLDQRFTRDHLTEDWLKLLQPLIKMVALSSPGLPVAFVYQFYTSKGRSDIASAVTSAAQSRSAQLITVGTLDVILRQVLHSGDVEVKTAPLVEKQTVGLQDEGSDVPLWQKFRQKDQVSDDAEESTTIQQSETPDAAVPLWKQFQPNEANTAGQPAVYHDPAIVVLGVGINHKNRFINDLFNGDENKFNATMNELGSAPDWTTASEIIADHVFRMYQVDIYSESAVDFTNAVESRYSGDRA